MISKCEQAICPWCGHVHTIEEWDNETFLKCKNREMKRAYTHLYEEKAFFHKSNTFYICGYCKKWSRGSQLRIVNTTDEKLLKLGGEPIVTVPK